ncbi:MAG TPA: cytochrome c [Thermoanaerobaculia bacterium]
MRSRKWRVLGVLLVLAIVLGALAWYHLLRQVPQAPFANTEEAFKYGSIGAEDAAGLPYWIWYVLPRVFPDYLPRPGGYASLGLPWEPGKETPIGFSRRTIGFERIAINCAFCHTTQVRQEAGGVPKIYPGGASNTFDVLAYQRFLFNCAADPRFNAKELLHAIAQVHELSFVERTLYRFALIPQTRKALLKQKKDFEWTESRPDWGPGRIDPFNPVKVAILNTPVADTIGNSDMVPIWNLGAHEGISYHWDGMNDNIDEVFRSSSLGDGATPKSIPLEHLAALRDWLKEVMPPAYPFPVNAELAKAGQPIYAQHCGDCHERGGSRTGKVEPLASVGTDPHRSAMWRQDSADAYNAYVSDYPWGFKGFRATDGYVNMPLDGLWIRAPYLHNGSVPTLADLLETPDRRPKAFYRGYDVFDPVRVGFISDGPDAQRLGMRIDVSQPGNGNEGHLWGTQLSPQEKTALLEYMKTL